MIGNKIYKWKIFKFTAISGESKTVENASFEIFYGLSQKKYNSPNYIWNYDKIVTVHIKYLLRVMLHQIKAVNLKKLKLKLQLWIFVHKLEANKDSLLFLIQKIQDF